MELDATAGSICYHYHSWRSKSSQLRIVIAFSFACVASDLLGPAAEAHTYTYSAHNGWHSGLDYAHRTLVCSLDFVETAPAASQTKFLQSMSGSVFIWIWDWSVVHLCCNFMDHMRTHTQFIVLIVMWWPQGEWSQRKFISTLSELYQLQQKRIFKTDLKQCIGWLYSFWI